MSDAAWQPDRYITNDEEAEQMAAAAMRGMGYADARETPVGPDGGVDVRSKRAIAQVKFRAAQTGRSDLQRLVGARGRDHTLDLLFFAAAGYSGHALEYAAEMDIALFVFDPLGRITATSPAAQRIQAQTAAPLRRRAAAAPSPTRLWWRAHWWQVGTVFCLVSFPVLIVQAATGDGDTTWGAVVLCLALGAVGTAYWRYRRPLAAYFGMDNATPKAPNDEPPSPTE